MVNDICKRNEETYMKWLSKQVSPAQLSELYQTYKVIDHFMVYTKISKESIFETFEYKKILKIKQTVESNKAFRFQNRANIKKCISAVEYLAKYAKQLPPIESTDGGESDKTPQKMIEKLKQKYHLTKAHSIEEIINDNPIDMLVIHFFVKENYDLSFREFLISQEILEDSNTGSQTDTSLLDEEQENGTTSGTVSSAKIGSNEVLVSFSNPQDFSYTKPLWFNYKNRGKTTVNTWSALYTEIMRLMTADYPNVFVENLSLLSGDRVDIARSDESHKLRRYARLTDALLIEINISARDFNKRIVKAASMVGLTDKDIVICFEKNQKDTKDKATDTTTTKNGKSSKPISRVQNRDLITKADENDTIDLSNGILSLFDPIKKEFPEYVFTNNGSNGAKARIVCVFASDDGEQKSPIIKVEPTKSDEFLFLFIKKEYMSVEESDCNDSKYYSKNDADNTFSSPIMVAVESIVNYMSNRLRTISIIRSLKNEPSGSSLHSEKTVSFENNSFNYAYTEPIWFRYKENSKIIATSWTGLYVAIMRELAKEHPGVFVANTSILNDGTIDIVNVKDSDVLNGRAKLIDDLLIEKRLSETDIVKRIIAAAAMVSLTNEDIEICYNDAGKTAAEDAYKSLNKTVEFLKNRYSVRLGYDHYNQPFFTYQNILYKVNNGKIDIMWVYGLFSHANKYVSIETEPEYLEECPEVFNDFLKIIKRKNRPHLKMIFNDFNHIKDSLNMICNSIDSFFDKKATKKSFEESVIYQKLLSISKIFDDPTGLSLDKIMSMLGTDVEEQIVINILNSADWATRIDDTVYSFAKEPAASNSFEENIEILDDSDFYAFLKNKCNLADATCNGYVSAIRCAEDYARQHQFKNSTLFNCIYSQAFETLKELKVNAEFMSYNRSQHNRFSAAFVKFELYLASKSNDANGKNGDKQQDIISEEEKGMFIRVLMQRYQNGMQFDSIDFGNFRDTYKDLFDEEITYTDEELEKKLCFCGIIYKGRLFPADGVINETTGKKLLTYIENHFASGNKAIYYKAIMADMADDFAYCFSLADEDMLREYIKYSVPDGQYYFYDDYMTYELGVKIDHTEEIANFMLSAGKPLSYDEIFSGLSHISAEIIKGEIRSSSLFLMDHKEHYFHIGIFQADTSEIEMISDFIDVAIKENGYVVWQNIYENIKDSMPIFLENNLYLSSIGIRNAIQQKLFDKYCFDGAIISPWKKALSMADVFRLYAKQHPKFTDEDILEFANELDTNIYFSKIFEVSIRVSKNLFVSKELVTIDVDAVDAAIETYFSGNYVLIKEIDSFLVFPNIGYEWNEFLLEGFLKEYSKKFVLLNNYSALNNVAGAVIRRSTKNIELVDVCADVLASSDIQLNKTNALNYLVDMKLITRRAYREIDTAINKAILIRNRGK